MTSVLKLSSQRGRQKESPPVHSGEEKTGSRFTRAGETNKKAIKLSAQKGRLGSD